MLTRLDILSQRASAIIHPPSVGTEQTDEIRILKIDGLGPVTADVTTTRYGTVDGEYFTGATVPKRNVVITFGLNPNWSQNHTYELLRQQLLLWLMPKSWVKLLFHSSHLPDCFLTGIVESFEDNMFSQDPQIQASIICTDPYFQDNNVTTITGFTVADNSVLTEVDYGGSVPVGFTMDVEQSNGVPFYGFLQVSMQGNGRELLNINNVAMNADQFVRITTMTGNKAVMKQWYSGLRATSYLAGVPANSQWPQLKQGSNYPLVIASAVGFPWTLRYQAKYGSL